MELPIRSSMKKLRPVGQLVFDENFALLVDPTPDFPFKVENGTLRIEVRKGEDGKG